MRVVLLKDVPKVGRKYDVKDVSDGHALNFLIPRGLAEKATSQALKKIESLKANKAAEKKIQGELLVKNLETIENLTLTLKEKANEKGHLFAGLTKEMLAGEIFKATRLNIDPESINLPKPLKETGEHKVKVEALGKIAEFIVIIEAE